MQVAQLLAGGGAHRVLLERVGGRSGEVARAVGQHGVAVRNGLPTLGKT